MRHKYIKYVRNDVWQFPSEQGIWYRERQRGNVLISMCTLGNYVLNLHTLVYHGYNFAIKTLQRECILDCSLSNGLYFDTTSIDKAECVAEFIWKQTLFYEELKWAAVRTLTGTRWKRIHWGIRG